MSVFGKIYRNENDFNFPKGFRYTTAASLILLLVAVGSFAVRGLNMSIDFTGGAVWEVPTADLSLDEADAIASEFSGPGGTKVQELTDATGTRIVRVQADVEDPNVGEQVKSQLAEAGGVNADEVSSSVIGPSWGREITSKAIQSLVVFLVVIFLYISIRLEWRMAVGALAAVVHDVAITVGVYSLFGLLVTPATVISFLTILGFSLYDTIVVDDRVLENTKTLGRTGQYTFTAIMRRSMNQVIGRTINTSVVAVLPVAAVFVVGLTTGQSTLQEFSFALLIGLILGAYSSIGVASPITMWLKEKEPRFVAIRKRLADTGRDPDDSRWHGIHAPTPAARPAAKVAAASATISAPRPGGTAPGRTHPPRPAKKRR